MDKVYTRRSVVKSMSSLMALATIPVHPLLFNDRKKYSDGTAGSFTYCLNTSTIMGQDVGIVREIEIAAEAGYDGVEIWIPTLEKYLEQGGSLNELKQRIADLNIQVENAIGFAAWVVDDHDQRTQALEQCKREMDMLHQLGCKRIAAPPFGAAKTAGLDLDKAAERFRALLELGIRQEVIPQLEVWGFSKNLHKLSQVMYVAAECGHPEVRILPDIYHLFKGGSDFDGLKLIDGKCIEIFHMNDYPDDISRAMIEDKDRVYPGLGIGPVTSVLQDLKAKGNKTVLSLELFNRDYWAQDPMEVAKKGIAMMRASVEQI